MALANCMINHNTPCISPKQQHMLQFIRRYIFIRGYAPTTREIADYAKIKSRGVVSRHLKALEEAGLIQLITHKRRGIQLTNMMCYFQMLIIGRIAAGNPIEPIDKTKILDLADLMVGPNRYVLQVKGNSMSGDNICDGDYIICEHRTEAKTGEIAVVLIRGKEATLKRIQKNNDGTVTLLASNPAVEPMLYNDEDIKVQGIYLGLVRLN